jgi:hypothetical protein
MPNYLKILHDLQHHREAQRQTVEECQVEPDLALLRAWQTQRLAHTYADLLADPKYAPACQFFLSDIYGPRDFSQRDSDAVRLHDLLSRFLPEMMLRLLGRAIQINELTSHLDAELARALVETLGVTDAITPELYAAGYRVCNNYDDRVRQIELLAGILTEVCEGAKFPLVGVTLKLVRGPALNAGWFEVYDFLERGYAAARHMKDVKYFVGTIHDRETLILERIFNGHGDPFGI